MARSISDMVIGDMPGTHKPVPIKDFPKYPTKEGKPSLPVANPAMPPVVSPDGLVTPNNSSLPSVLTRGRGRPKGSKNKIKVPGPAKVARPPRDSDPSVGLAHKARHVVEMQSNNGGGDPEDYGIILSDPSDANIEPSNSPSGDCGCGGDCCDSKPSIITNAAVDKAQPDNYSVPWRRF